MINQAPAVSLCKTTEQFSCAVTGLYKYMKDVQDEGKEKQSTSEARMSWTRLLIVSKQLEVGSLVEFWPDKYKVQCLFLWFFAPLQQAQRRDES